jgi:glycosyltransferase involved in cell wall biosynthesis
MKRVMQDDELAQKLANAGWKKYRAEFTEEVVVGKYKEFFEKVIG